MALVKFGNKTNGSEEGKDSWGVPAGVSHRIARSSHKKIGCADGTDEDGNQIFSDILSSFGYAIILRSSPPSDMMIVKRRVLPNHFCFFMQYSHPSS